MSSLVHLDEKAMQQLVAEVKETIALDADYSKNEKSALKAVDVWKMQKNKRSATSTFASKRNYIPFI